MKRFKRVLTFVLLLTCMLPLYACSLDLQSVSNKNSKLDCTFYFKDDELWYNDFSDNTPIQLTSKFWDTDEDGYDFDELLEDLFDSREWFDDAFFPQVTNDENYVFYPDRFDYDTEEFSVYYRNINDFEEPAIKLDSSIYWYCISENSDLLYYIKWSDDQNFLYSYNIETEEKCKIDTLYSSWANVSDDCQYVAYLDKDNNLCYSDYMGEKEKIASNVTGYEVVDLNVDTPVFYYFKDNESLYVQTLSGEAKKIDSNVDGIYFVYETGEVYYTKSIDDPILIGDIINVDIDSYSEPVEPEKPDLDDYDDYDEYFDAKDDYNIAYEDYLSQYEAYEEYTELMDYVDIIVEDKFSYDGWSSSSIKQLYYFDGEKSSLIDDSIYYYSSSNLAFNESTPIAACFSCDDNWPTINLSDILNNYYEFCDNYDYRETLDETTIANHAIRLFNIAVENLLHINVAIKDKVFDLQNAEYGSLIFDGKTNLYLLDDSEDASDLYYIEITNDNAANPVMFDTDVEYYEGFTADGDLIYCKEYDDYTADIYINKKPVDYDVYDYDYNMSSYGIEYYISDFDDSSYSGTLKHYVDGEKAKIANDVVGFSVTGTGKVIYLSNYDIKHYCGDLYLYKNDEPQKLDIDVQFVF